jgi:hypothetical protein
LPVSVAKSWVMESMIAWPTSSSLGTPFILSINSYFPFALEDGGWLAPMMVDLVDHLAILVLVRSCPSVGAAGSIICFTTVIIHRGNEQ